MSPAYTRALIDDPSIQFIVDEGRSALSRDPNLYDVIQMTGVDTWTGLKSGAYVLAENYLYTQEAIREMYDHLAPGGILQIIRMAQEMEALRMIANIDAALVGHEAQSLRPSLISMRTGDVLAAFLVKKGAFSRAEVDSTRRFIVDNGITPIHLPGYQLGNVVETFVRSDDKAAFIENYPRDISPTTDDRPYFFNFTRWTDPLRSRGHVEEPPHVSQGNPFFILIQFLLSAVLSVLLIVAPLLRSGSSVRSGAGRYIFYFASVGLGFIMIEISMMQKLTVVLGHPIYSITVTLASVLFFAGLGSLISGSWFRDAPNRAWCVPFGLALLIGAFLSVWPLAFPVVVAWPLVARIAVAVTILAPVSLLLGVPFAYGIRLLNQHHPATIPWAWAVNGCFSVMGSILAVIASMTMGFAATLALGTAVYFVGFAALTLRTDSSHSDLPVGSPTTAL